MVSADGGASGAVVVCVSSAMSVGIGELCAKKIVDLHYRKRKSRKFRPKTVGWPFLWFI
jgi:hypothetical protein